VIFRIVVWWSLFTALTGSVQTIAGIFTTAASPVALLGTLIVIRFLFGVGEAGAYPNIARAVGRWFPFRERATAQGAIWMSSRIGGAISPAVMGQLIALPWPLGGWQGAFLTLGLAGVLWAGAFFLWFRDRPEEMPAANPAECELIRSGSAGPGSIYDDSHAPGVPWKTVLCSPNLLAVYGAAFCVSFSWYFYVTFFPKYLKGTFGRSLQESEWLSGLPLLAGGLACLTGGRLSDLLIHWTGSKRWGRSLLGIAGFGLAGGCALLLSQPFLTYGQAVALSCLAVALQDLAVPCIWSLPTDVGGRYAGTVAGCMNTVGAIGGAVASPLTSWVAGKDARWDLVFLMFAVSYVIGALMWVRIDAGESIFGGGTGSGRRPAGAG
jgi:MFS family permease